VIILTLLLLYSSGNDLLYPMAKRIVTPKANMKTSSKKKNAASPESKHGTPAPNSATTLTELYRIVPRFYARK